MIERLKGAVAAHERRRADADVNIGGACLKTHSQEIGDAQAIRQIIGRADLDLGAGLLQSVIGLGGGGFHGGSRRVQRLAQALRLFRIDDPLFQQELDGRKLGHGLKGGHGGLVLVEDDPPRVIGGGQDVLVKLGSHGKCDHGDDGIGDGVRQQSIYPTCQGVEAIL